MSLHTHTRPASFHLPASVDPVGVRQALPMQLKPSTSSQKWTPEIIDWVLTFGSLTTLPRSLIPTRKFRLRPPVMHYGWKANMEKFLAYAEQHNLTYQYKPMKFSQRASDDGHDGPGDKEEEDDSDDEIPAGQSFDEVVTLKRAVSHIVNELNLPRLRRRLKVTWPLTTDEKFIISVYTNYDLAIASSDDDVEALRQALGETEKPVWYLDSIRPKWRSWDY